LETLISKDFGIVLRHGCQRQRVSFTGWAFFEEAAKGRVKAENSTRIQIESGFQEGYACAYQRMGRQACEGTVERAR
jgi:hypothetical protein